MTPRRAARWVAAILFASFLLPAVYRGTRGSITRELPNDVYIWQRRWTPAVEDAVLRAAHLVRAWRVLAAEADLHGRWSPTTIDPQVLTLSHRTMIPVFRIDGRIFDLDGSQTVATIQQRLAMIRQDGIAVARIEIDFDCPVSKLPRYAQLLARVRAALPESVSITALPAWLDSPEVQQVFAQADEIVLQVHAVQQPGQGLFDLQLARRWINELARRTNKPFRVALPTYGSRVSWTRDGSVLAVESEMSLLAGGDTASELIASPKAVSDLVRDLKTNPPSRLAGLVWFRLPTVSDRRAWSFATWRDVMVGRPLESALVLQVRRTQIYGMSDLVLVNDGEADIELPNAIDLPRVCRLADGVNGYGLAPSSPTLKLARLEAGLLHSHTEQVIGWMRCAPAPSDIHVQP